MHENTSDSEYVKLRNQRTGGHEIHKEYKEIVYPFDRYQITVRLTPSNEFIGIVEVKINKDFRSYKQKITSKGFHDVDEFYKE